MEQVQVHAWVHDTGCYFLKAPAGIRGQGLVVWVINEVKPGRLQLEILALKTYTAGAAAAFLATERLIFRTLVLASSMLDVLAAVERDREKETLAVVFGVLRTRMVATGNAMANDGGRCNGKWEDEQRERCYFEPFKSWPVFMCFGRLDSIHRRPNTTDAT